MRVLSPPPVGTRWIRYIQNDGKEQSGDIRVDETAFKQHMCGLRSSKSRMVIGVKRAVHLYHVQWNSSEFRTSALCGQESEA